MFGLRGSHINSFENKNADPGVAIYPMWFSQDASYSIKEELLGSAIFVPPGFEHGNDGKTPVILVPGTGTYGGEALENNFAKLLKASPFADPIWLNIPGRMCNEASKNAEYVAYAVSCISSTTGKMVAVVAWSQGNLSTQWTLKYRPGTRDQVIKFICLSADFRGTDQTRNSDFIVTLRSNGGDSAYVPTTSIYSATDEVVQSQFGPLASALMNDDPKVGVTNCELQACARLKPAGIAYSHETVMYNPLAWALAEDTIKNGGPGRLDRIDMKSVCMKWKAPGLSVIDTTKTQALTAWALKSILLYIPKPWNEPGLPLYATSENKTYKSEDVPIVPTDPVRVDGVEVPAIETVVPEKWVWSA